MTTAAKQDWMVGERDVREMAWQSVTEDDSTLYNVKVACFSEDIMYLQTWIFVILLEVE